MKGGVEHSKGRPVSPTRLLPTAPLIREDRVSLIQLLLTAPLIRGDRVRQILSQTGQPKTVKQRGKPNNERQAAPKDGPLRLLRRRRRRQERLRPLLLRRQPAHPRPLTEAGM